MKIKPLLARLQSAIGRYDLMEQMVLLPAARKSVNEKNSPAKLIKLIVGYDGSPNSHTALDIAFCIAHQTHLATSVKVDVQVVYVIEKQAELTDKYKSKHGENYPALEYAACDFPKSKTLLLTPSKPQSSSISLAEKADKILWQAKTLAQEWQSYFQSHLRFGDLCFELQKVVELESADALFLGCQSSDHPLIERLDTNFPCPVLGIPNCLD